MGKNELSKQNREREIIGEGEKSQKIHQEKEKRKRRQKEQIMREN